MTKPYRSGMYGGKFLPLHKGHLLCVRRAAEECERVFLILFANGAGERQILSELSPDEQFSVAARFDSVKACAALFDNVTPVLIDVSSCRTPTGEEDWDAETPMVLQTCGKFDAVYSSEPSYGDYFSRAYPWAEHRLVDPPRILVPISATQIRSMTKEEALQWLV